MKARVLFVDDDPNILSAHQRSLRKHFDLVTAQGGEAALVQLHQDKPFAVVLSDMRMPGMDGVQFLQQVQETSPDSVRMMLTGNADVETAMMAVNHGNIFRFLTKPCEPEALIEALEAGAQQYQLLTAEKQLLEGTLKGSVKVLTEVLSLVNPMAFGRSARLRRDISHIVSKLKLPNTWQYEMAAMLSQIGCVVLSPDLISKVYSDQELSDDEAETYHSHPELGSKLLINIPRMEEVSSIIAHQFEPFSWSPDIELTEVPVEILGGHLLRVAIDFDQSIIQGLQPTTGLAKLRKQPDVYCPALVTALEYIAMRPQEYHIANLKVDELSIRMIVDQDVLALNDMLLVARGQEITHTVLAHLRRWTNTVGIAEPIRVLVPS